MLNPIDRFGPEEFRRMRGYRRASIALAAVTILLLAALVIGLKWHPCLCFALTVPMIVLVMVLEVRAYRCPRCWRHVSGPSSPDGDDSVERCRIPNHCWYCGVKLTGRR